MKAKNRRSTQKSDKSGWPNIILRNVNPDIWRSARSKAVLNNFTMGELVNAWAEAWIDGKINIPKEK